MSPISPDSHPIRMQVALPPDPASLADRGPDGDGPGWAEALLEAEGPILGMIGAGRPPAEVLEALCLMTEALCPGVTCSVLLMAPDGRALVWGAAPGLPSAYRDAVVAVPVGPGCGSCGTAAHLGEPVACADIAADPSWAGIAHLPLALGLRACLSTPFLSATGRVLGTFCLYFREPRRPSDREARVARRTAKLAGIAWERHASDDLYRRIVETTLEGVWQIDADQRTAFVNPRMAELLGFGVEEMLGRPVWDFVPEEDRESGRRGWERKARGEREATEYRFRRKDGSILWALGSTSPVFDETGRFAGALGMFSDITGRKRAEEALALQARVLESMTEGVRVCDEGGTIVYANPAEERIFGYGSGELIGLHATAMNDYPPGENARFVAGVIEHLRREGSWSGEVRNRKKDGTVFWTSARTTSLDRDGRTYWVCVQKDVTEEKAAREALRASEEHYRAVYNQAAVGIVEVDLSGRFLRANDRYCEIVGYGREDLFALRFHEITHPDDLPANLLLFDHIVERQGPYTIEKRYLRKDGREVWVRLAVSLVRDGAGRPTGVVGVAEDVTARVSLERELHRRLEELAGASKRGEELLASLQEGEERFRGLMEQAPFSIQILAPDGRTLRVNRAWERLWGVTLDRVADYNILRDPQLEAKGALPGILRAFAGEPSAVPAIQYDPDETLPNRTAHDDPKRWVSAVAYPLKDASGRVREVVLVHEDVTEKRRAEEALRASEERLRQLADAVPQMVWMTRPDRSVEYVNRRWLDYTGQTLAEALGPDGWRGPVHPEDLGRVIESSRRSHAEGGPFEEEYRLRDRSGVYRWFLGRAVPMLDEAGRIVRRFGTATDIDDRKRAEHAARFLAEASATLSGLVDEAGTLEKVARLAVPAFADWCSVDLADEGGRPLRVAVAHVDPAKVEYAHELHRRYPPDLDAPQGLTQVIRTGRSELVPEITDAMLVAGARDDGHLEILRGLGLRSYLCVPLIGREGTLGAMTFVAAESGMRYGPDDLRLAEDLAHRAAIALESARLYTELKENDRRKGEFLATLAHELRNPLAPVRSAARLLAGTPAVVAEAGDEVAMIERQVAHLARLVDDLMDVARIERGKVQLSREVVELAPLVRHALGVVRPGAEARGHHLEVSLPEAPIVLEADPTRLEQVLDNLLTNAIKYTEPGGRIVLDARREGDRVAIRVRDTGIGIPAGELPGVFAMFAQVDGRSARAQGGLGIGLGLVQSLVELHGGTVTARSDGPGAGSEFLVLLPALPGDPAPGAPPPRVGTARPSVRRRILVVDDNRDAADSLARLLSRLLGQEARAAYDGPEGLAVAESFRPEVVLLDIGMPGMDGHEVARRLRRTDRGPGLILIALTGWGQEDDRRRSRESGFDHHLVKPVGPDALAALLAGLP